MEQLQPLIQKLIEFVETASPVVWEAAYRQAYMQAIANSLVFLGLITFSVFSARWYRHFTIRSADLKERDDAGEYYSGMSADKENSDIARVAFAAFTIIAIGWALLILGGIIGRVLNPDYYAIKVLASMVGL